MVIFHSFLYVYQRVWYAAIFAVAYNPPTKGIAATSLIKPLGSLRARLSTNGSPKLKLQFPSVETHLPNLYYPSYTIYTPQASQKIKTSCCFLLYPSVEHWIIKPTSAIYGIRSTASLWCHDDPSSAASSSISEASQGIEAAPLGQGESFTSVPVTKSQDNLYDIWLVVEPYPSEK